MARAKRGFKARRRRNRIRQAAKGYRGGRSKLWKAMVDTVHHAWRYATWHRRTRKRDFRRLWIVRINAAARQNGMSYGAFFHGLKLAGIELDRKVFFFNAAPAPETFRRFADAAREASAASA